MTKNKQKGLGLLDVLFALALLGLIYAGAAKVLMTQKETNAAQNYRIRIEQVIEALQKYQYQQHTTKPPVPVIDEFPTELNDLVTVDEQFWINCTEADEVAKRCIRPDYVPWTKQRIGYEAGHKGITIGSEIRDVAYVEMTFPLSNSVIEPMYRAKWATELLKMPYAKAQSNGDITVMVYDPLLSQLYDEFLQRDGSVTLTDDWDAGGNHAITNAKDFTIANSDGTQKIVSEGLVDVWTVEHGDKILKPSCPANTEPKIALSISYIRVNKEDKLSGSVRPWVQSETSDYWEVGLSSRVNVVDTGEIKESFLGKIQALTFCRKS